VSSLNLLFYFWGLISWQGDWPGPIRLTQNHELIPKMVSGKKLPGGLWRDFEMVHLSMH